MVAVSLAWIAHTVVEIASGDWFDPDRRVLWLANVWISRGSLRRAVKRTR
jgi:hypothetical protein